MASSTRCCTLEASPLGHKRTYDIPDVVVFMGLGKMEQSHLSMEPLMSRSPTTASAQISSPCPRTSLWQVQLCVFHTYASPSASQSQPSSVSLSYSSSNHNQHLQHQHRDQPCQNRRSRLLLNARLTWTSLCGQFSGQVPVWVVCDLGRGG